MRVQATKRPTTAKVIRQRMTELEAEMAIRERTIQTLKAHQSELTAALAEMDRTNMELRIRVVHLKREVERETDLRLAQLPALTGLPKFARK